MGSFSVWHWLIVLVIIVLLFGSGRISSVMGEVAKGIKNFKKGLSDDDVADDGKTLPHDAASAAGTAETARTEKT